jgi:hypothetical protein
MADAQGEERRFHTVSLPQYAAVKAAVAEDFPLEDVLGVEEIPAEKWGEAEPAWKELLVTDGEVFQEYTKRLADAEDWLGRKVVPLNDDVGAWVAFLAALKAGSPFETVKNLGLRMTDVSRLRRRWDRKVEKEPELRKKMADLRSKVDKAAKTSLPEITAEPLKLKRSQATGPAKAGSETATKAAAALTPAAADFTLDRYAALVAELARGSETPEKVLGRHGLTQEQFVALEQSWKARFESDKVARVDFGRLLAYQRGRMAAWSRDRGAPGDLESAKAPPAPDLPDHGLAARPRVAPRPVAAPRGEGARAKGAAIYAPETVELGALDPKQLKAALPFAPVAKRADPDARKPATAEIDPRALRPPLPFSEGTAPDEVKLATKEPKVRPARKPETVDLDRTPEKRTLPFGRRAAQASVSGGEAASEPGLTLEQHASLCTEIAFRPDRAAETLARYGLTPEVKAEMDAVFKARMAADAEVRGRWYRASETYLMWLMSGEIGNRP